MGERRDSSLGFLKTAPKSAVDGAANSTVARRPLKMQLRWNVIHAKVLPALNNFLTWGLYEDPRAYDHTSTYIDNISSYKFRAPITTSATPSHYGPNVSLNISPLNI